jgi:hypothetical protein
MPDTHITATVTRHDFAKRSFWHTFAAVRCVGSPVSLLLVGLMGETPGTGPRDERRNLAGLTSAARAKPRGRPGLGSFVALTERSVDLWHAAGRGIARFVIKAALVLATIGFCWALRQYMAIGNLALPFLIAILLTAIAFGLGPSLFASVLSVLLFDFLFLEPLYSLTVSNSDDVMRLVVFALTAAIVSNLAAYARRQAVTASDRARVAENLYRFSRRSRPPRPCGRRSKRRYRAYVTCLARRS